MKVKIIHNQKIISKDILLADTFWSRLVGLMFKKKPKGDGLLLEPGKSIHTFFMRYDLDVIFMNKKNQIIKIIRGLKPWRMTWIYFSSTKTLELPAGKLPPEVKEGDTLEVTDV